MELFDSHLHLDDQAFDPDRGQIVARAREAGVARMVTVGTGLESCRAAVALAEQYPDVFAALAIHPHDAGEATKEAMATLRLLAGHPKAVAIGETGLDFVRQTSPPDAQRRAFRAHLALARTCDLPVIIHCREAYPEVLRVLDDERVSRVIMHAFSGSVELAQQCVDRGYCVSLAGPVTYKNAHTPREVARAVPIDRLLIETDAPVLTPVPHRGRRNEPAYLTLIAARIAEIRGQPMEEVAAATTANARRIYGVDDK
ncbi:MAG: TatD family hydrolase [bacterium]